MHNFGFDKMHGHDEQEGWGRGRGFGRGPRGPRGEGFEGGGFGRGPRGPRGEGEGGPGFGPMGGPGFGPMGGPGFGPMGGPGFGPMGGGFRGRPGGRGPGRGRRGDVRNAILALLAEQPMNGYQLISAISDKTQGLWSPSAGSIYPALGLLTDEGLIQETEVDGRKANELTDAGRAYVEEHADELRSPWDKVAEPHQGFLDVRPEVRQLAMAVQQVVMAGDRDQIEAVRRILDAARRDVYRLLAGDIPPTE